MKEAHCKVCDQEGHYAAFCFYRAKKPLKNSKKLKQAGKYSIKWKYTKNKWHRKYGNYGHVCHICGMPIPEDELTLDHVIPRSRRPDLRYDFSNIKPAHWLCNYKKGSKVLD